MVQLPRIDLYPGNPFWLTPLDFVFDLKSWSFYLVLQPVKGFVSRELDLADSSGLRFWPRFCRNLLCSRGWGLICIWGLGFGWLLWTSGFEVFRARTSKVCFLLALWRLVCSPHPLLVFYCLADWDWAEASLRAPPSFALRRSRLYPSPVSNSLGLGWVGAGV